MTAPPPSDIPHTALPQQELLRQPLRLSDIELQALSKLGAEAFGVAWETSPGDDYGQVLSAEEQAERRARYEEEERKRQEATAQAAEKFERELEDRLQRAYVEGQRLAEAESGRRDALFRGYVLYVVVAAIVLLPFVAMLLELKPETFGSYVAPVTGVAGTIVGYWFGSGERGRGASRARS